MKIIANIIGKDESDRYLVPVLERLREQVDEIAFTDDCSYDDTFLIARDMGAHTIRLDEPLFEEDPQTLRRIAWEHVHMLAAPGDWVLNIDCDEMLYMPEGLDLHRFLESIHYQAVGVMYYHMWTPTHYRADKTWTPTIQFPLFRYYDENLFSQPQPHRKTVPLYVSELSRTNRACIVFGMKIKHLGFMSDEDRWNKHDLYMETNGREVSLKHVESIVDKKVELREWTDGI